MISAFRSAHRYRCNFGTVDGETLNEPEPTPPTEFVQLIYHVLLRISTVSERGFAVSVYPNGTRRRAIPRCVHFHLSSANTLCYRRLSSPGVVFVHRGSSNRSRCGRYRLIAQEGSSIAWLLRVHVSSRWFLREKEPFGRV